MIRKILYVILCITFGLFYPIQYASSELSPPESSAVFISLDFKDASLKDILKVFSMQSGLNFIASHSIQEREGYSIPG